MHTVDRAATPGVSSDGLESEAIVVTDIVGATARSSRFGDRIGIKLTQDLQGFIEKIGEQYGMQCLKNTGDGYLTAYRDPDAAIGAVKAVEAAFELLNQLAAHNQDLPPERSINVRVAIHFGEVYAVAGERHGLNVAFAFRLEGITPPSPIGVFDYFNPITLDNFHPMPPEELPEQDYVLCSEIVAEILKERKYQVSTQFVGLFKLKGIPGWQEVYLVSQQSNRESNRE